MPRKVKVDVKVGMKFRKMDTPGCVLEVIELYTPDGARPHAYARVSIANHDLGVRLYSVSALTDKQLFTPLDSPSNRKD